MVALDDTSRGSEVSSARIAPSIAPDLLALYDWLDDLAFVSFEAAQHASAASTGNTGAPRESVRWARDRDAR